MTQSGGSRAFGAQLIVVKLGGRSFESREARARQAQVIASLVQNGAQVVVAHGGGAQVTAALALHGIEARFVEGLRVTDDKTLEVMEPVVAGLGKELAHALTAAGAPAVSITGRDARLVRGHVKKRELGRVGSVDAVNVDLLRGLAMLGLTPVVGPIAVDDHGPLNVNADEVASALAKALKASHLVLCTDVDGVKDAHGKLLARVSATEARDLVATGVATGGMIPKINGALDAIAAGVGTVHIVNGQDPEALAVLFSGRAVGTAIVPGGGA